MTDNKFSLAEDMALGQKEFDEISADKDVVFVHDADINRYLHRLVARLLSHLSEDFPQMPIHVLVVRGQSESVMPAGMAIAGGYIFLPLERLSTVRSEAALALQLSHEIGHVELRHGTRMETERQMIQDYLTKDLLTPNASESGPEWRDLFQTVDTYLNTLHVQCEDEADIFAIRLALKSGYDPHDYMSFLADKYSYPEIFILLNHHRSGDERARRLEEEFRRIQSLRIHSSIAKNGSHDGPFQRMRAIASRLLQN